MEQPGLEPALIWDVSAIGRGLESCITVPVDGDSSYCQIEKQNENCFTSLSLKLQWKMSLFLLRSDPLNWTVFSFPLYPFKEFYILITAHFVIHLVTQRFKSGLS